MFYALFDFEYEKNCAYMTPAMFAKGEWKRYFMTNPFLYKVGLQGECFSSFIFVKWLLYALFHAVIIEFLGFYFLEKETMITKNG